MSNEQVLTVRPHTTNQVIVEPEITLRIGEVTLPNENISFTTQNTENSIQFTAELQPKNIADIQNQNISWQIEDNPANNGTSPIPDISNIFGNQVNIRIDIPSISAGRNYERLSYRIRAKIEIGQRNIVSDWHVITQDEIDMLRQQYLDMGKNNIPDRNAFINSGSSIYFNLSEGACNCGNHSYHIWSIMSNLDNVREGVNHRMIVNSGYRCPLYNSTVSNAANSQHIYGTAADIRVSGEDFNNDGQAGTRADWDVLSQAANNAGASYIEPYDETGTWVHMDWRG